MLRLWAPETSDKTTWRFSTESPDTGEKQIFANLDYLVEFLETLIEASSGMREDAEAQASKKQLDE